MTAENRCCILLSSLEWSTWFLSSAWNEPPFSGCLKSNNCFLMVWIKKWCCTTWNQSAAFCFLVSAAPLSASQPLENQVTVFLSAWNQAYIFSSRLSLHSHYWSWWLLSWFSCRSQAFTSSHNCRSVRHGVMEVIIVFREKNRKL